jgi:AraC-like DNA-binding protein
LNKSDKPAAGRNYHRDVGPSAEPAAVAAPTYYREVAPAAPLRHFVECLWVHLITDAEVDGDRRILPDGRVDLVWIRGLGTMVAGPQSRFTQRPLVAPMLAFGARFHPGAAPTLLRTPAAEFLDDTVPLAAVDAGLARRLDESLLRAADEPAAFEALNRELVGVVERLRPDPVISEAVGLLAERSLAVAQLAADVYVSERQLERRFAEHVGYGPKTLQRIFRLQRVVRQLESAGGDAELAGVAASASYADQAHLSRESRRLTGLTPRQLVRWIG